MMRGSSLQKPPARQRAGRSRAPGTSTTENTRWKCSRRFTNKRQRRRAGLARCHRPRSRCLYSDGKRGGEADIYGKIIEICTREIKESNPTDPDLFARITAEMEAAGIQVD